MRSKADTNTTGSFSNGKHDMTLLTLPQRCKNQSNQTVNLRVLDPRRNTLWALNDYSLHTFKTHYLARKGIAGDVGKQRKIVDTVYKSAGMDVISIGNSLYIHLELTLLRLMMTFLELTLLRLMMTSLELTLLRLMMTPRDRNI